MLAKISFWWPAWSHLKMTVLGDSPGQFGHIIQILYSEFFALGEKIFSTYVPKKAFLGV